MLRTVALAAIAWTCAACGAAPMEVSYRAAPGQALEGLSTYAWAEQPAAGDTTLRTDALRTHVRAAVDEVLIAKGLSPSTASEAADLVVYWYAAVRHKAELRKLDYTESAPAVQRTVDVFEQGTLVIDVVDRRRGTLLWRATAQARLRPQASEAERAARVREAVARMFENFPPR